MSKKHRNQPQKPEIERQSDYYKLKIDAVNDLVTANEENSPTVSEEELRAYRSGPKMKIADWVKMLFIRPGLPERCAISSCGGWAAS